MFDWLFVDETITINGWQFLLIVFLLHWALSFVENVCDSIYAFICDLVLEHQANVRKQEPRRVYGSRKAKKG